MRVGARAGLCLDVAAENSDLPSSSSVLKGMRRRVRQGFQPINVGPCVGHGGWFHLGAGHLTAAQDTLPNLAPEAISDPVPRYGQHRMMDDERVNVNPGGTIFDWKPLSF